ARSIEPFTSAKRTVTCFRSPSSAERVVRIFSARWFGVYARTSRTGAAPARRGPQSSQNFAVARVSWPPFRQGLAGRPDARRSLRHEVAEAPQLDPPGRELQRAERRVVRPTGPEERRVVADGHRRVAEEAPHAVLLVPALLPRDAALDVHLLLL